MNGTPVLVTTQFRGVFFGYLESNLPNPKDGDYLVLKNARNCIYWDSSCGGFLGLAKYGPNDNCKVGAEVDLITLYGITSVSRCSEESVNNWKSVTTCK